MTTSSSRHHGHRDPPASDVSGVRCGAAAAAGGSSVSGWRRAIDGAVLCGRAGRLLALLGGWLAVAAILVVVVAAIDLAVGPSVVPVAPWPRAAGIIAASGVAAGIILGRRLTGRRRPTRLRVCLATERAHPLLGERLSSAVEFLDALPPVGKEPGAATDLTLALRRLAVEQAATAARGVVMTVPGLATDLRWVAAGVLLPTAVWLSTLLLPSAWGRAVGRSMLQSAGADAAAVISGQQASVASVPLGRADGRPDEGADGGSEESPRSPAADLPPAVAEAATRIGAAARLERLLAGRLAVIFTQAPGVQGELLSRGSRHEIDELAAIQTECLRTVESARDTLRLAAGDAARDRVSGSAAARLAAVVARLDDLDAVESADSLPHIRANRLALAAAIATDTAAILADAAGLLGNATGDGDAGSDAGGDGGDGAGGRWPAVGPLLRATATLERMIAAAADNVSGTPGEAPDAASGRGATPADDTLLGPAAAAGGDGAATDPRAGNGAGKDETGTARPAASGTARASRSQRVPPPPIEQVWSLLPPGDRAEAGRAAIDALPAAYRPAIDAYYRLLLDSTSRGRSDGPPFPSPAPGDSR